MRAVTGRRMHGLWSYPAGHGKRVLSKSKGECQKVSTVRAVIGSTLHFVSSDLQSDDAEMGIYNP